MKKHRLKFILIFIFLRLISLVWNSYLMEASDGKITTNDILSSIGFGAIYLIFYNAPIYYLYIVVLEFVCKKLNNKFITLMFLLALLGSYFVYQAGYYGGKFSKEVSKSIFQSYN